MTTSTIPRRVGRFWPGHQRGGHSLHHLYSYRASFNPGLPRYVIEAHTHPGAAVLDPFAGRGTVLLEAALLGRRPLGVDLNPVAVAVTEAKLHPVSLEEVDEVLAAVRWPSVPAASADPDLLAYYHPGTLAELEALRRHLEATPGEATRFVTAVALSRLHGHSRGFLSAYTYPQAATTPAAQRRINAKHGEPEYREVAPRIRAKARAALRDGRLGEIRAVTAAVRHGDARRLPFPDASVDLVVTSPPFLDQTDYAAASRLALWFLGAGAERLREAASAYRTPEGWSAFLRACLVEWGRVVRPGGVAVVEVGEVPRGTQVHALDDLLLAALPEPWEPVEVLVHDAPFTKLAHTWGTTNGEGGTNTQRLVVLRRAE